MTVKNKSNALIPIPPDNPNPGEYNSNTRPRLAMDKRIGTTTGLVINLANDSAKVDSTVWMLASG